MTTIEPKAPKQPKAPKRVKKAVETVNVEQANASTAEPTDPPAEPSTTEQPKEPKQPPSEPLELTPADDPNLSPMKKQVIQQTNQILEIINNANNFKANYNELINTIIPTINNQLKKYTRDSKKSVLIDAVELTLDGVDWSALQSDLSTLMRAKKSNVKPHTWKRIPKPIGKIEPLDDEPYTNMYMSCDVEHVKEFQRYRKLARGEISDLLNSISDFENELCSYRSNVVGLLQTNIQTLFDHHYNYVNDLYHKRGGEGVVIIDGHEVKLVKSQKAFIIDSLKQIVQ